MWTVILQKPEELSQADWFHLRYFLEKKERYEVDINLNQNHAEAQDKPLLIWSQNSNPNLNANFINLQSLRPIREAVT